MVIVVILVAVVLVLPTTITTTTKHTTNYSSPLTDILKVDILCGQNFSFEILRNNKCKNITKNMRETGRKKL